MRLFFLLIYIFCGLSPGLSQNGYSVTYQNVEHIYAPITFNGEKRRLPKQVDKLIFSDSLSFCYRIPQNTRDPLKNARVFGEKLIHHAMMYNSNTNLSYSEVAWPIGKKKYLIRNELKNENWQFISDTKEVLGYLCRGAIFVNDKNDTTLVWFTDSIHCQFGPNHMYGFPGLVLEYYQQPWNIHIRAEKIETGDFQVVMPQKGIIISPEDYRKLKR